MAKILGLCLGLALVASPRVEAGTYYVTNINDTGGEGSLRLAIYRANQDPGSEIIFQDNLGLMPIFNPLPIISASVTIKGGVGNTIYGQGIVRPFFIDVPGGTVTISNLTIAKGHAQGGQGGDGGGGGGLGAGGAVFINSGAVTLEGVVFEENSATGGAGGRGSAYRYEHVGGGGGGGLGGAGGAGVAGSGDYGGGGGGGYLKRGGNASHGSGGGGGIDGAGGNGAKLDDKEAGGGGGSFYDGADAVGHTGGAGGQPHGGKGADANSAASGENGGVGGGGGGGGSGWRNQGGYYTASNGGDGGRFGGGGAAGAHFALTNDVHAGQGGEFGGGGGFAGLAGSAGNGGWGGGGGGSVESSYAPRAGNGGFGAGGGGALFLGAAGSGGAFGGNGGAGEGNGLGGGGGGAGLGGAVFVRAENGASLTLKSSRFDEGAVTAGAGGAMDPSLIQPGHNNGAKAGAASGSAIFLGGGTTTIQPGANDIIAGSIGEHTASALLISGSGSIRLAGVNSYSGGTKVAGAATVEFSDAHNLGSGPLTLDTGAVRFLGSSSDWNRGLQVNSGGGVVDVADESAQLGISGVISGTGGFHKIGAGRLRLTGVNTFTGALMTWDGKVEVAGGGRVQNAATSGILGGAEMKVTGAGSRWELAADLYLGHADGAGTLIVESGGVVSNTFALVGRPGGNGTAIVRGAGSEWKNSTDLVIGLEGGTGSLIVADGGHVKADLAVYAGRDAGGAGTIALEGTAGHRGILEAPQIRRGGGSASLNWNGGIFRHTGTHAPFSGFQSGDIVIGAGGAFLDVSTAEASVEIAVPLSGTGAFSKLGPGVLILSGSNSFQGGTAVEDGVLVAQQGSALGTGPAPLDLRGGRLDFNGSSLTVTSLSGSSGVFLTSSSGPVSLTVDQNSETIFGGRIWSDNVSLTKKGSGLLQLTGSHSFKGGTVIEGGVLRTVGNERLADAGAVMVNGGSWDVGEFQETVGAVSLLHGSITGSGVVQAGEFALQTGEVSVRLVGAATLTKSGTGKLLLGGDNSYAGGTVLLDGTLGVGHDRALGSGVVTIHGGGIRAEGQGRTLANTLVVSNTFTVGRATAFTGSVTLASNVTIVSSNPDSGTYDSEFAGTISGPHSLTFTEGANPNGGFVLSGSNTYTNGTVLQAGRLAANHDQALGQGDVTVYGGTLIIAPGRRVGNEIVLGGGNYERTLSGDLAHAVDARSVNGTKAQILAGATEDEVLLRTSFLASDERVVGERYSLDGTEENAYVLQLTVPAGSPGAFLGTFQENGSLWLNAREGNSGNNPLFAQQFHGSFSDFQNRHGTDLSLSMGAWGWETNGGTTSVWTVLSHPGTFAAIAAVPEPGTLLTAALGVAALLLLKRRKLV